MRGWAHATTILHPFQNMGDGLGAGCRAAAWTGQALGAWRPLDRGAPGCCPGEAGCSWLGPAGSGLDESKGMKKRRVEIGFWGARELEGWRAIWGDEGAGTGSGENWNFGEAGEEESYGLAWLTRGSFEKLNGSERAIWREMTWCTYVVWWFKVKIEIYRLMVGR